jgi:hypothetical protein
MATNKAKRTIHLAQDHKPERRSPNPNPRPNPGPQPVTGALPVKSAIYRALAEVTTGFDKVIHDFGTLKQSYFFRTGTLSALHDQLCAVRAQAIREFLSILGERETANAERFERLCSERGISPPAGS